MVLPLILLAFVVWLIINSRLQTYINMATTKGFGDPNGGKFGGAGASGSY